MKMKQIITYLSLSLIGILIFNISSEKILNSKFTSLIGLIISGVCALMLIISIYKLINTHINKISN